MATDLHGGLVQRQPPPRRFRIPFDDTPRIFAAHAGTRTNHGTFQPCAGTSVASVHLYKAGASQYINYFVLPLSYSAQERPLPQAYAPCGCEARGHAYGADGRIRTCDFPSSRFTLRSDPLPRLRYICIEGGARLSEPPANHVMAHRRFYVSRVLSVPEHTCSKENLKTSLLGTSPCVRNYNIEA